MSKELFLWEASSERKSTSRLFHFIEFVQTKFSNEIVTWEDLYTWSISDLNGFWLAVSQFTQVKWKKKGDQAFTGDSSKMLEASWFKDFTLNYAENLLPYPDKREVLVAIKEGLPHEKYSSLRLCNEVAALAKSLKKRGVKKGDTVAAVIQNSSEAIIAMLATASLGAIWSSCSPDFGVHAILDRFSQIHPKVLFYSLGYRYQQKYFSCVSNVVSCLESLKTVELPISIPSGHQDLTTEAPGIPFYQLLKEGSAGHDQTTPLPIDFEEVPFDHPLFIMFSSGTTGKPKCMVHGVGGTLLQHLKELILHVDMKPSDRLLYFTTTGWMMWNWMVSGLATGGSLCLYDGSPLLASSTGLWGLVDQENITILGTSPKYLQSCISSQSKPKEANKLITLKTILSTGSPLMPEQSQWIYQHVKEDVHLASISGGTDIISCFMLGNPLLPVYAGEIQSPGLGMALSIRNDAFECLIDQKGELVCEKPFVAMPLYFLNDHDHKNYKKAYFEYFPGRQVWRHGDFVKLTKRGSLIVYGRSDATLNPGGVRIGTSEIYREVENIPEVSDSLAVSFRNPSDVLMILFIVPNAGYSFNDELILKIKKHLRTQLSPRHVPAWIFAVKEIPYTRSGKKVEIAVERVLHGEPCENLDALVNPDVITEFKIFREKLIS